MAALSEPLATVQSTPRLIVEPIWEYPIDDIEGSLYRQYIDRHPGYAAVYVRKTVKTMLETAAESLPLRYTLIIRAGHRPLEVQLQILDHVKQRFMKENPLSSEADALAFARIYVSDPAVRVPPHCCGAAVDVDMRDNETGQLVDFGCSVNTNDEIASIDTKRINEMQQTHRTMLFDAMMGAGFALFQPEWWHFSYGDQAWAKAHGKKPLYGTIDITGNN